MPRRSTVFLAMPHYDGTCRVETAQRFWNEATDGKHDVILGTHGGSLLASVFNILWEQALQARAKFGIDYFAMLHSDVVPEKFWLDTLIDEVQAHQAALMSCVVAIKDKRGLTSTGIDLGDGWNLEKRFTMTELEQLPSTFNAAHCGFPDRALLVNTGCWVVDFRSRPSVDTLCFEIKNRRVLDKDGNRRLEVAPEDWNMSRHFFKHQELVMATRRVKVNHIGGIAYGNQAVWGTWKEDQHAPHERLQQSGVLAQRQGGDSGGQTAEASPGDSVCATPANLSGQPETVMRACEQDLASYREKLDGVGV